MMIPPGLLIINYLVTLNTELSKQLKLDNLYNNYNSTVSFTLGVLRPIFGFPQSHKH